MPKKRASAALLSAAKAVVQEASAPEFPVERPRDVLPAGWTGVVAVDTESNGLFSDDGARTSTVSVSFYVDGEQRSYAFPFDQGERDKVRVVQCDLFEQTDPNLGVDDWVDLLQWLDRDGVLHVYHNAKHDLDKLLAGTRHWDGVDLLPRFWWDTAVANRELWPVEPIELKGTYVREIDPDYDRDEQKAMKAWLKKKKLKLADMDKVPWSIAGPYATTDALMTIRLQRHQAELYAEGAGDRARLFRQFDVTRTLYLMERRGLGFDAAGCLAAADLIDELAEPIAARLPFEPTGPAAKKYFFEDQGLRHYAKQTKTQKAKGQEPDSLDDEVTFRMAADGVPFAADWAAWSKYDRALSMWYRGWPAKIGSDGRLRTSYRQTKVVSGRMSVERVQLQAVPKGDKDMAGVPGVRSFVSFREGHRGWNLDLSQAELRVASRYAGCKKMLSMLEAGADLHGITTQEVLHVDPSAPDWKFQRDIAKRLTFGGIFQVGAATFQGTLSKLAHIDLPLDQCTEIVRGWRSAYPEFGWAYRDAEAQADRHGWVTLMRGCEYQTRSYFGPRDWPNTAWNRTVQGSLAEFLQLWLVAAEEITGAKPVGSAGLDGPLILTVHDSLVLELPDEGERVPDLVLEVQDWAEREATRLFKIAMKVDVGPWHKD